MRWKILLGAVLLLTGAGLAAWLWIDAAAERKWASMERRIAELRAEAAARDCRRPPRPGLVPGNAWDDYLGALDLLKKDPEIDAVLPDRVRDPEPANVEVLLDRNADALAMIRRGARRAEARHPELDQDLGLYAMTRRVLRRISDVCWVSARRLAREGHVREAADVLLDLLQAGGDLSRNAIYCYSSYTDEVVEKAVRELAALPLSAADRRAMAGELERLEAELPSCEAEVRNIPLWIATGLEDKFPPEASVPWRFGFSRRIMVAAAFERTEELLRLTAGIDALRFTAAEAVVDECRARAADAGNPALQLQLPDLLGFVRSHRVNQARLRLLRAAFHEKATGERLALPDPFGTTLRGSAPGEPLRLWSVGSDGKDDGGKDLEDVVLKIP